MTTRRSKRPTLTGAKRPTAGRAGVAHAVEDHQKAEAADAKPPRSKATFDLPPELLAELRVASVIAGETLASICERALSDELERLRTELNDGRQFPMPAQPRARRGRPPK